MLNHFLFKYFWFFFTKCSQFLSIFSNSFGRFKKKIWRFFQTFFSICSFMNTGVNIFDASEPMLQIIQCWLINKVFQFVNWKTLWNSKQLSIKLSSTLREIFSQFGEIKPTLDCNYTFAIDLAPNGISFGPKTIGKW